MFLIFSLIICSLGHGYVDAQGQRVAPGVPPQQYQQQQNAGQQMHQRMPQQQMHNQQQFQQPQQPQQQQQQQFQQPPQQQQQQQQQFQQQQQQQFQQQQIPVQPIQQQQQQQILAQQIPQQAGHAHDHGHIRNPQQLLNAANLEHEKAHIAEHISVPMDTSKMTDQELQFHYFKMHDADNNNKLDGCELIKSLIHWHEEQGNNEPNGEHGGNKLFTDDELQSLIDPILDMDDLSRDGFIDYPEFIQAQQKAAATGRQ